MANRKDICVCGHTREEHNNRITGKYYPEIKYNACMHGRCQDDTFCYCYRFRLKTPFSKTSHNRNLIQSANADPTGHLIGIKRKLCGVTDYDFGSEKEVKE